MVVTPQGVQNSAYRTGLVYENTRPYRRVFSYPPCIKKRLSSALYLLLLQGALTYTYAREYNGKIRIAPATLFI